MQGHASAGRANTNEVVRGLSGRLKKQVAVSYNEIEEGAPGECMAHHYSGSLPC